MASGPAHIDHAPLEGSARLWGTLAMSLEGLRELAVIATAPAKGLPDGPLSPGTGGGNSRIMALGNVVLVLLLTTLPVSVCAKGKFVTANWLVSGVKWPPGLDSTYK